MNSAGLDLSNELHLASLGDALHDSVGRRWTASPTGSPTGRTGPGTFEIRNPADRADIVGTVSDATPEDVDAAIGRAAAAAPGWQAMPGAERAACLHRAATLMEARMPSLLGLIVREAGKSLSNAIAEVREAVDFLRYYGNAAASLGQR